MISAQTHSSTLVIIVFSVKNGTAVKLQVLKALAAREDFTLGLQQRM